MANFRSGIALAWIVSGRNERVSTLALLTSLAKTGEEDIEG